MNVENQEQAPKKQFWQSSNFWNQIVTLIAAGYFAVGVEFPTEAGQQVIGAVFSLLAGGNIVYHVLRDQEKRGKFSDIFKSTNFWTNLLTVLVSIVPVIPVEALQEVINAILTGNWQALILAGFNLLNIIYKLVTAKKPDQAVAAAT